MWTSSLLLALIHATNYYIRCQQMIGRDWVWKKDVRVCVLDNSGMDTTSIFAAIYLLDKFEIPDETDRIHHYDHTAEYLVYGELCVRNRSTTTSLRSLISRGLFDVVPVLEEANKSVNVRDLPQNLKGESLTNLVTELREVNKALNFGSFFEKEWAFVKGTALLSCRARSRNNPEFMHLAVDLAGEFTFVLSISILVLI